MSVGAYFAEAFAVLAANRVRTVLTALGLIIGVTAVIAIQVLGAGMAGAVSGILGILSDRTFYVAPDQRQSDFTRAAIRLDDLERMSTSIPNVVAAIPGGAAVREARFGHALRRVQIGAQADVRFATSTPLTYGRKFTTDDISAGRHVCIISGEAAQKLNIVGDQTGRTLRVGDRRYTIVGILETSHGGVLPALTNIEVALPYPVYEREYARGHLIVFAKVLVDDITKIGPTESATLVWLKALKKGRVEYQTFDRKSFSRAVDGIFTGVTLVVGLIGGVSLLVAGIGILNIMLVSVAERTREIGLRKAIGATRFQVLLQFFIEALALSAFGCAVGLALGVGIGALVNDLAIVHISGVVAPIPWLRSIGIATGFATIVTLVFGTYPAWRAATLDPIKALRYE